ncbi:hypothetical protein XthCFBP4691_19300 [Xanthomonas theicola]|uniref:Uncharacterized protein n=1 Tax=Xanthomonas theicola TaxID=56464 RepID=A0A2S6Z7M5_9XANT|nr:hypothetical protein XthCFBP4691_19300 [Xanthomonas theicola]QNH26945.1 hypothetical protein G4Q83_03245 [Xanthomonas theicola]
MAASSLKVDCGAVLGWHGTLPTGSEGAVSLAAEGAPGALVEKYRSWLDKFHADERAFYSRAGVNYAMLEHAGQQVKMSSGKADEYTLDEKTGEYSYTSTPSVWIPQGGTLQKYGVAGAEYCPGYTDEMIVDAMKKAGVKSSFVLEH